MLRDEWVEHCLRLSRTKADFYSGCRKIIRDRKLTFEALTPELVMADAGFTKAKMSYLKRAYLHEESREVAVDLWNRRKEQGKYGSIGFTCYNHLIKGHAQNAYWNRVNERIHPHQAKVSRASVMGPCIQSVVITLLNKKQAAITLFYRTTELFKKFPADLVFVRDVLLEPFDFTGIEITEVTCHFANITCHPMYFVTLVPLIEDPVAELIKIGDADPYFRDWIVKWTARYTMDEYHRGIAKFAQAMRVRMDALNRIDKKKLKRLNQYMGDTHPGHRNDYVEPDEEDEE